MERLKARALGTYTKSDLEDYPLQARFMEVVQEPFQLSPRQLKDTRVALAHAIEALAQKNWMEVGWRDKDKTYAVRLLQGLLADLDLAIRGGAPIAIGQSERLAAPKFGKPDPRTAHPAWPLLRLEALSAVEWLSYCMPRRDATAWVCSLLKELKLKASPTNLDNWREQEAERFHSDPGVVAALHPQARHKHWKELRPENQFNAQLFGDVASCGGIFFANGKAQLFGTDDTLPASLRGLGVGTGSDAFLKMAEEIQDGKWLRWDDDRVSDADAIRVFKEIATRTITPLSSRVLS